MCDCIKKVDEQLKAHNAKLELAFPLTSDLSLSAPRMLLRLQRIDTSKRKKLPDLQVSFCPFCGEKIGSDS